jgi:predicted ArsR family transcriptional regulator
MVATMTVTPHERDQAGWMQQPLDDRLLDALATRGAVPAEPLAEATGASPYAVRTRLQLLAGYGLIERRNRTFLLTARGERYLAGAVDADDLGFE